MLIRPENQKAVPGFGKLSETVYTRVPYRGKKNGEK